MNPIKNFLTFAKEYKAYNDKQKISDELEVLKKECDNIAEQKNNIIAEREQEAEKTRLRQEEIIEQYKSDIETSQKNYSEAQEKLQALYSEQNEAQKKLEYAVNKLSASNKVYKLLQKAIDDLSLTPIPTSSLTESALQEIDTLCTAVEIPIHTYDIKDLRTLNNNLKSQIKAVYKRYEKRYTTKTNKAIYSLMVMALEAEIQNIISALKFSNYDKSVEALNKMTDKYLQIATEGNNSILPTLTSFIGEMNVLYKERIDVEYNYYIKQEQIKQEQQALREQMRQEAAEQLLLRQQQEKLEKEEQKYNDKICDVKNQIETCNDSDKIAELTKRLSELQEQLANLEQEKDEILKLQNGKAGYVYVISNLGSFGNDVFKIGMTRRLDPAERIRELSCASVPFAFDIHSFIFSDDAVALENQLHERLDSCRVNKVNTRKEFFRVNIDDLEQLVQDIDSSAEFTKTMLAAEYNQTLNINKMS